MNQILAYFCLFLAHIYLVVEPVQGNFKLQILHNNDFHGRFDETDETTGPCPEQYVNENKCFGGFARMRTASDRAKKEGKANGYETLYLNAGDFFQGTPYFTTFEWSMTADMVDRLGLDLMALGNHEFDLGVTKLQEYVKQVKVPIVCSNLDHTHDKRLDLPNILESKVFTYKIKKGKEMSEEKDTTDEKDKIEEKELSEGEEITVEKQISEEKLINVGIVAYLTPLTKNTDDIIVKDEIPSIRAVARELRETKNVKIVIALGHSGLAFDKILAEQVEEVNLIIGGDSHDLLYTLPVGQDKPPSIEKPVSGYPTWVEVKREDGTIRRTPIVQAYAYSKYLGQLFMEFDDDGNLIEAHGNPILLDSSIQKDKKVEAAMQIWQKRINKRVKGFKKIQGHTRTRLAEAGLSKNKFESNMANLITDAFVDAGVQRAHEHDLSTWTNSPISFYPNGGIKMELDNNRADGVITLEDIMSILPFKNDLCEATVLGTTMRKFLEDAVATYNYDIDTYEWKDYMQFSGLRIVYDVSRPANKRLISVDALCKDCSIPEYSPLKDDEDYSFIAPCFVADKFKKIQTAMSKPVPLSTTDIEAVQNYIKRRDVVASILDNRVKNIELGTQKPTDSTTQI